MNGDMYFDDERLTRTVTVDTPSPAPSISHLKRGATAGVPATAAPVDEPTRRRVITAVLDPQNRPDIAARVGRRQNFDDWLVRSPLVEIGFDDEQLRTASSMRCE